MNSKKNWANGGTTEQTRNQKPVTWTVRRVLAGENERTRNRVNEPAKLDEQLNDRVDSSFVCSSKRL